MSKKYKSRRKQQMKAINPVIWFIGGGVFLIAAALFLAFGGNSGGDTGGGTPALAVDKQTIDYGDVKLATDLTFEIKVTNTGDGTLRFKEEPYIEVREGC
jgi:hypothetical protein